MNSDLKLFLGEYFGTFFFILAILSSGGNPLIIGGALAFVIYMLQGTTKGHVNPAVSFTSYLNNKITLSDFAYSVASQLLGGASALYAYKSSLQM
jgi:glycerol uptake facilitator-like aquaporin